MNPELLSLYNKIKNKENFSLVRYGDGEQNIMDKIPCNRKGFDFDPSNEADQEFRNDLIESKNFESPRYYKGMYNDHITNIVNMVSPCIFVNEKYLDFLDNFSPLFEGCIFVGNELGMDWQLPFKTERYIRIKENAWKDYNSNLLNVFLSRYLTNKSNQIILVAGGPMSNVLIYKLYKNNPDNTYLNVGSTFDPFIFGHLTRKYQERLCK